MTEEDITSYMNQFKVDRETAIKEIEEVLELHYSKQDEERQEIYRDIIRGSY